MKRYGSLVPVVGLLGLLLIVCATMTATAQTTPPKPPLKVALLTSGPITDEGWNQSAYEGLQALQRKGYEVANTEMVASDEQLHHLRRYATQGFNIIVGHGFEFGEVLLAAAREFPDTAFIQIGGTATAANLVSYVFRPGEGGYLAGVLAVHLSKTGKWGFVGAVDIPSIATDQMVYETVIKQARANASVTSAYTGSWVDIAKAKAAALAQISSGVDVILANGDNANIGAIQAAREQGGVLVIGWTRDQSHLAPNNVALSVLQHVDVVLQQAVSGVQAGTITGGHYVVGLTEGLTDISPFGPMVPPAAQAAVQQAIADLKAGRVTLPHLPPITR